MDAFGWNKAAVLKVAEGLSGKAALRVLPILSGLRADVLMVDGSEVMVSTFLHSRAVYDAALGLSVASSLGVKS